MSTVATLWVKLGLDSKGYQAGLDRAESTTASKMSSIGKSMMKTGLVATTALTVPIVAGLGKAVSAASSLEESVNAVNVVFGDAADTILAFGEQSATAVGLANSEFNSMATITGALLQNLGFDADDAAESTINLASRAADMASVFDTDVDQALNAVNSALKGEFNPLEQFGVKLNAADINARAMAMGLADAEGALDNNAKAQAALSIIMEQTDKIAGDFINTSDSLANSQRILGGQLEDVAAQLGTVLLPFVAQAVQWLSKMAVKFQALSPATQKTIVIVLALVAAIGPLLLIFGALASAIGAIITVFGALAPVFAVIGGVIGAITLPIALLIAAVVGLIIVVKTFGADAANTFNMIAQIVGAVLAVAFGKLIEIWNRAVASATMLWEIAKVLGSFFAGAFKSAIDGIGQAIQGVVDWVLKLAKSISEIKLPDWLTPGSPTPFELGLLGIGKAMHNLAKQELPRLSTGLDIDMPGIGGGAMLEAAQASAQSQPEPIDYEKLAEVVAFTVAKELG